MASDGSTPENLESCQLTAVYKIKHYCSSILNDSTWNEYPIHTYAIQTLHIQRMLIMLMDWVRSDDWDTGYCECTLAWEEHSFSTRSLPQCLLLELHISNVSRRGVSFSSFILMTKLPQFCKSTTSAKQITVRRLIFFNKLIFHIRGKLKWYKNTWTEQVG